VIKAVIKGSDKKAVIKKAVTWTVEAAGPDAAGYIRI
jgi:hypothetical protein